jgi:hypothetical protein
LEGLAVKGASARFFQGFSRAGCETEEGVEVLLKVARFAGLGPKAKRIVLAVQTSDSSESAVKAAIPNQEGGDLVYVCVPRGVGPTRWTRKNPPNYVERSHVLLGRTVDSGRVWDIIATVRYLRDIYRTAVPLYVTGEGTGAVLAAYAALWEEDIAGVIAVDPPTSHMADEAPVFLNVLRVCDIPDVFGMLAPRSLVIKGSDDKGLERVRGIYEIAGAGSKLSWDSD